MGLLEGRKTSRNEGQGGNSQSAVVPWQRPLCAPCQHLVSLPGSSPPAHLPCPGHPGSPPRPRKPCVALRVSAMGVLVELFAGDGRSWCSPGTAPQECWRVGGSPFIFHPAEKSHDSSSNESPPWIPGSPPGIWGPSYFHLSFLPLICWGWIADFL